MRSRLRRPYQRTADPSAPRTQAEVANGPPLPAVPVVVLTGMKIDPTPGRTAAYMEAFSRIKRDAHRALVDALPRGEHRVLDDAGHRLTAECPEAVVDAVFSILDRVAGR